MQSNSKNPEVHCWFSKQCFSVASERCWFEPVNIYIFFFFNMAVNLLLRKMNTSVANHLMMKLLYSCLKSSNILQKCISVECCLWNCVQLTPIFGHYVFTPDISCLLYNKIKGTGILFWFSVRSFVTWMSVPALSWTASPHVSADIEEFEREK